VARDTLARRARAVSSQPTVRAPGQEREKTIMADPAAPIVFTLTQSEAEAYWRALGERQKRSGRLRYSWVAAFAVPIAVLAIPLALLMLGVFYEPEFLPVVICVAIAYLAGFFALRYEMLRALRRRGAMLYRANAVFAEERTVRLGTEGLEAGSRSLWQTIAYDAITDVELAPDGLLVWVGTVIGIFVPMRAFAGEVAREALAAALRERIMQARR
jgi:hypothetical protein